MAKICKECGVPRGTKHKDECSSAAPRLARQNVASAMRRAAGIVRSKLPLTAQALAEGLAMSRSSGREILHTPMNQPLPGGDCPCGSGQKFRECHGEPQPGDPDFTSGG